MPAFRVPPTAVPTTTGYDFGSVAAPVQTFYRSDPETGIFSVQTTTLVNEPSGWGPLPTDDPNRPDSSDLEYQPTATPVLLSSPTRKSSISAQALVGITVSAGIVVIAVVFATLWWMRKRSRNSRDFGNGSRRKIAIEVEEEKPPSYEAAVFGIQTDNRPNLSLNPAHQPSPPSVPQPTLQSPLPTHHIHSPRPVNVATTNRTLHRLDRDPESPRDIPRQPDNIIIYPHDSPPPSPSPPSPGALSIRSAPGANPNRESSEVLSHHITDFTEDYPDTASIGSDHMDEEEVAIKEIV